VSVARHGSVMKIAIRSDPSEVCGARSAAERFAEQQGFGREQAGQIGLALNEALANVITHGYGGESGQRIIVTMEPGEDDGRRGLKVVVRDFGRQVDPAGIKGRDLDQVRPGGLGVHIMKTVMDQVHYRRCPDGGMELTMLKLFTDVKGEL